MSNYSFVTTNVSGYKPVSSSYVDMWVGDQPPPPTPEKRKPKPEKKSDLYDFEDVTEYNGKYGYVYPNEDITIWRDFVKGKHIRRAAAVCSGGEVGLLCLLPTVRDELVLIDHSYCAIRYALQKYLLIQKHGFRRTAKLITEAEPRTALKAALAEVNKEIPEKLLTSGDKYSYTSRREEPVATYCDSWSEGKIVRDIWGNVSPYIAKACSSKLGKIKFVHGDFQSLADKGPFDLFYLSNAQQSGNGNKGRPSLAPVTKCVRPGGHVIVAGDCNVNSYAGGGKGAFNAPKGWKLLETRESTSSYGGFVGWEYRLFQIGERET